MRFVEKKIAFVKKVVLLKIEHSSMSSCEKVLMNGLLFIVTVDMNLLLDQHLNLCF